MKTSIRPMITASILSLSSMGCLSAPAPAPVSPAQSSSVQQFSDSQFVDYPQESTADRYEPMVNFLQQNNMSLRDWDTLSEAYYSVQVIGQKSETRLNFMHSLNELVQNTESTSIEESIQNSRNLRRLHRELRLGQR